MYRSDVSHHHEVMEIIECACGLDAGGLQKSGLGETHHRPKSRPKKS
jgi:hypothetical protein